MYWRISSAVFVPAAWLGFYVYFPAYYWGETMGIYNIINACVVMRACGAHLGYAYWTNSYVLVWTSVVCLCWSSIVIDNLAAEVPPRPAMILAWWSIHRAWNYGLIVQNRAVAGKYISMPLKQHVLLFLPFVGSVFRLWQASKLKSS